MDWIRQDIAFPAHDGVSLCGWLYLPEGGAGVPGIVMSHGFTATKEMGLPAFAEIFAAAGMAVLLYDHRAIGASAGEPRGYVDAWVQSRDMLAAVAWLAARGEVDGGRIGLWGTSFSGGEVLVLGGIEPAVRAVVALVPFAGTPGAPEMESEAALAAMNDRVRGAAVETRLRPVRTVIAEDGSDDPGMLAVPEAAAWFGAASASADGRWTNRVLMAADPGPMAFNPAVAVPHLHAPALFIIARDDRIAHAQDAIAVAGRAPQDSEVLIVEGHHFSLYEGDAQRRAGEAARDFFLRVLSGRT